MTPQKEQVARLNTLLENFYGLPGRTSRDNPLDTLIKTVLSQNTSDVNSRRAYKSLKNTFQNWEEVLESHIDDIAESIKSGGLANQKSQRIQRVLKWLKYNYNTLDMQWVCQQDPYEIIDEFTDIKGIGIKTIAIVLCFDCGQDIFPVDTHVNRVCKRLGLSPANASPTKTFWIMDELVPAGKSKSLHLNVIRHGREICKSRKPLCNKCMLLDVCNYGRARTKENRKYD